MNVTLDPDLVEWLNKWRTSQPAEVAFGRALDACIRAFKETQMKSMRPQLPKFWPLGTPTTKDEMCELQLGPCPDCGGEGELIKEPGLGHTEEFEVYDLAVKCENCKLELPLPEQQEAPDDY